jgi:hypothetical protein
MGDTRYYVHGGTRIPLQPSQNFLSLRYRPGPELPSAVASLVGKPGFGNKRGVIALPDDGVLLLPIQQHASVKALRDTVASSALLSSLDATQVDIFETSDGAMLMPDGTVDADLSDREPREIQELLLQTRSRIVREPSQTLPLHVLEPLDGDPFHLANTLAEGAKRIPAQPRFRKLVPQHLLATPSVFQPPQTWASGGDPFLPYQWGLRAIHADQAWSFTRGHPEVAVAVLDTGVDLGHDDLSPNLLPGYDVIDHDGQPEPRWDPDNAHGTACAGIIAAVRGNGIGVSGVAPGCTLIPMRLANCEKGHFYFSHPDAESLCIYRAVERGASVINLSYYSVPTEATRKALHHALSAGRGGKGCVVVAAAGNDNSCVKFPATFPDVIAVAATREDGRRCTPAEWGPGQGSCFGSAISVAAPGHRIWTTDLRGQAGRWPAPPQVGTFDYTHNFRGTSAACAFVSGVAALVLSRNRNLTAVQVRELLERTADKRLLAEYGGGPRNNYLGHGNVDAFAAVREAL